MANVIKAHGSEGSLEGLNYNFDDFAVRADDFVQKVRAQAAQLLTDANKEAAQIRQRAQQEGRAEGMREVDRLAEKKVGERVQTLMPALETVLRKLDDARHEWLSHWERTAVHLASGIASRVIRREIKADPQIEVQWIREALELAAGTAELRIVMHPQDYETLKPHVETVIGQLARSAHAEVVPDASISIGGCRLETRFGTIDQTIEAQLGRIEEELT